MFELHTVIPAREEASVRVCQRYLPPGQETGFWNYEAYRVLAYGVTGTQMGCYLVLIPGLGPQWIPGEESLDTLVEFYRFSMTKYPDLMERTPDSWSGYVFSPDVEIITGLPK